MSKTYLELHPNPNNQMRSRRENKFDFIGITGLFAVHTAETDADVVGPDSGNANVARFISTRPAPSKGSYHSLSDSDDRLRLVPFSKTAYGAGVPTGVNDYACHFAFAASARQWKTLPKKWKDAAIKNMALEMLDAAKWAFVSRGIKVPAKRISRKEAEAGKPGLISHGELDPGRRTDPGKDFPWTQLISEFDALLKAWNYGNTKPAPKPPAPRPSRSKKVVEFYLGLANIRNKPNLTRKQVQEDAGRIGSMAGVGLLQEIFEPNDYKDVRAGLANHLAMTRDQNTAGKRGTTVYWNTRKFSLLNENVLPLPGWSHAITGGDPRYAKEVVLDAKGKDLPMIVFIDVHLTHGAWGKDARLAIPARRKWWTDQRAYLVKRVEDHRAAGRIVFIGGDWNRQLRHIPEFAADQQWVIGGKSSADIDGVLAFLPTGIKVVRSDEKSVKGHTDHLLRSVKLVVTKS